MRLFLVMLLMLPTLVPAAECSVRSGPRTAVLVELYTSEGCSSCPPADRWISGFRPVVANGDVVPVAFHVSYWDHIGWKDLFADPRHAERQRERAKAAGARQVYTPQVVVGGRDFPGWRSQRAAAAAFEAIRGREAPVTIDLALRITPEQGVGVQVTTRAREALARDGLAVVAVLTQDGLASRVTAGENRGEHLKHDFVVRDMAVASGLGVAHARFRPRAGWNAADMAVAAFVQDVRTGEVLQAVRLPLCRQP